MQYGKTSKKVCFETTDGEVARFIIKLRHEKIGKNEFFKTIMESYANDNEILDDFFKEYRKTRKKHSKAKEDILEKEREGGRQLEKEFALSEDEIEDIYDLFEEEVEI